MKYALAIWLAVLTLALAAEAMAKDQADQARDDMIIWCWGQPAETPIDSTYLGLSASDHVASCQGLIGWVVKTQKPGVGAALLRKAAQTDPVAKQRLDAWEAEQARLKVGRAALEKRHAATIALLHVGQTQAQVRAVLIREGFDQPWVCERVDPSQVATPGATYVTCLAYRKGVQEFAFLFGLSQRYGKRDPDTGTVTMWEVKTDKLTQIFDQVK